MSGAASLSLFLPSEEDTARLGAWLAHALHPGDVLLLKGSVGAGKTHLARSLIREALGRMEDVPSPTFTLVQTYQADGHEIWHADLYRLTHPDDVLELGLDAAFDTAVCLIEWPDRLGSLTPPHALHLHLSTEADGRRADFSSAHHHTMLATLARDWATAERRARSDAFVTAAGWGTATRRFLAGDASDRSYDRLTQGPDTVVLMDAPPGQGDDPADFIAIAAHLSGLGLSAPRVIAQDLTHGFLLLEDLGDDLFARLIPRHPASEPTLYAAATDILAHLQAHPAPDDLPDLSAADWALAADLAFDWYSFAATGERRDTAPFIAALADLLAIHANGKRVMILRDYHAENLLWLPERRGIARVGLLDFQLAQMGQPGYDLVSLLQDARRDVPQALETAMIHRFMEATGTTKAAFAPAYAMLGAQRALRIIGIFARLCLHGGKPQYLPLIPRAWRQLQRNLAHPALAPLAKICDRHLPEPTPDLLQRISAKCGTHPTR